MNPRPTLFLVDDDPLVLKALRHLLQSSGYTVEAFPSAEEYLERSDPDVPGCVICDVAMPGLGGPGLQRRLKTRGSRRPLIFLTAHGSIPGSVQAIKDGAEHYLTKPVKNADLLRVVRLALVRDAELRAMKKRLNLLTARERDVLKRASEGQLNKQIAADLGVTERTVKFHRSNLMRKVGITSAAKLARFAIEAGISGKSRSP